METCRYACLGTSGVLSPFGKIDGLYFNNSKEPDDFMFEFNKDISRIMKEKGVEYIEIDCDNKKDYYKILNELFKFNKNSINIYENSVHDQHKIQISCTDNKIESIDSIESDGDDNEIDY